jgi:hypothetical protein
MTTTTPTPIPGRVRSLKGTPRTIYKFWFQLNGHTWSAYELIPCGASFPKAVLEVFAWMAESDIRPLSVEMHNADAIGFWFTDLTTATLFKLQWHEQVAHEGDLSAED